MAQIDEKGQIYLTLDNTNFKIDTTERDFGLSDDDIEEVSEKIRKGIYLSERLKEDSSKVILEPGGEYTFSQFANSVRKVTKDTARTLFIKEVKNSAPYDYSLDRYDREKAMYERERKLTQLISSIGYDYGIFNYFNKNYNPTDIVVKTIGTVMEKVNSNNIYSLMAGRQYEVKEISFKVKVSYQGVPIIVKTRVVSNSTLNMRDIASFM